MGSEKNVGANTGMYIPVSGKTTSPYFEQFVIQCLQKMELHDHSSGKGAQFTQGSFTVTGDFNFRNYALTNVNYVKYVNPSAYSTTPGSATTFFLNNDFYIVDGSGVSIQLTKNGQLNTSLVGGFTGEYASSGTAFCVFDLSDNDYKFYKDVGYMSKVVAGEFEVRSTTLNKDVFGVRFITTGNIAATYAWTLPDTQASVDSLLKISSAGITSYATYTDFVVITGDQTLAGVKTFSSFPVTPSSAPSSNYQAANKKYVDDEIDTAFTVASPGTEYVWNGTAWVLNSGGSFPEAPIDSKQYARKNGAWDEVVVDVTEAPNDGKQYVRKNEAWAELVSTGGLTPLTASGVLAVNTIYSVDANGDFTFVVPTGTTNGDTIKIKRSGFGGNNVFTGAFRNSETAIIAKSWNYTLDLTWSSTRSLWIYE